MSIVIVANGERPPGHDHTVRPILQAARLLIAVDGGLEHCEALGVQPDMVIGDLDSVSAASVRKAEADGVEMLTFSPDKDASDLELALDVAAQSLDANANGNARQAVSADATVIVVAPFGGRLDHELATIGLLASPRFATLRIAATDGRRRLWVVRDELDLTLPVGTTLSLVPIGSDVGGVTTDGLQWPLQKATLRSGTTHGLSNVAIEANQSVSVASGVLLVVTDGGRD